MMNVVFSSTVSISFSIFLKLLKREEVENKYKWNLKSIIKDEEDLQEKSKEIEKLLKEVTKYKGKIMEI